MKFKTRLLVTSLVIIIVPLFLTAVAFTGIGIYMANSEQDFGTPDGSFTSFSYTLENYDQMTETVLLGVKERLLADSSAIEDPVFLETINRELIGKSSYLIVRKDNDIFYAGNAVAAERIFDKLPDYGGDAPDEERGYYYHDMKKLVKQLDFIFTDGSEGSLFIITKVSSLISQKMLIDMILAYVLILIFTSMVLTRWIQKGVFTPVNQLNTAMQNIAEGNFEYRLNSDGKGEIGELYRNYEDMRLRVYRALPDRHNSV